jgi:hypothetical protein
LTGFRLDEETLLPCAHAVKVTTLMAQLRRDFLIQGEQDGQGRGTFSASAYCGLIPPSMIGTKREPQLQ